MPHQPNRTLGSIRQTRGSPSVDFVQEQADVCRLAAQEPTTYQFTFLGRQRHLIPFLGVKKGSVQTLMSKTFSLELVRDLLGCGAIDLERVSLYSEQTREGPYPVFRDEESGVIFLGNDYPGDAEYTSGRYWGHSALDPETEQRDLQRRTSSLEEHYLGKSILDFGCGTGGFLRTVRNFASLVAGVDLDEGLRESLVKDGFAAYSSVSECDVAFDTIFAFHSFHHVPTPAGLLHDIRSRLRPGGNVIIEVPSAHDPLLELYKLDCFRSFTLSRFHLVLHTVDSLRRLLKANAFEPVSVSLVQRYPLSNHLSWLRDCTPSGFHSMFSVLDSEDVHSEYTRTLQGLGLSDTLIAVATALP